ncbi:hypothetical protein ACFL15_00970 [Patescibacteria group bacterium]
MKKEIGLPPNPEEIKESRIKYLSRLEKIEKIEYVLAAAHFIGNCGN